MSAAAMGRSSVRGATWFCAAAVLALAPSAGAQDALALDPNLDTLARVTTSTSELRAGPGLSYRVIERAERGDTFFVQGREATG
ncbi:MAG TPA: hypothetical protein VJU61_08690, partial [Polyangiaceae bacterium]|nr:hypothetical protein [Polyangiaceae bacterium]